jgi:hypothetical protein
MTLSTEQHPKEVKSEPNQTGGEPVKEKPEQGPRFVYKDKKKKKQMRMLYCYLAYQKEQKALLAFKMDCYFAKERKLTYQDRHDMMADLLSF